MPRFRFTFDITGKRYAIDHVPAAAELHPPRSQPDGLIIAVADYPSGELAWHAHEAMKQGLQFQLAREALQTAAADLDLGRVAYQGYCFTSNNRSLVTGEPLPEWSKLASEIQNAWRNAAVYVLMKSEAAL